MAFVHIRHKVNSQLERGRPFFVDIAEHGVALYEANGFRFTTPRKLPEEQARAEAGKYFDEWYPSAGRRFELARTAAEKRYWTEAAFDLHQTAERLYHCVLLVLTLHSPKSHKLNFLRSQAEQIAPELIEAWPREGKFERRGFELLRQAYVNARYSPHHKISEKELTWLIERVSLLRELVEGVCREHFGSDD